MIILKFITFLISAVAPVAVLVRDWKFHDKRTRKHHKITRAIIVIWFIGSIGAAIFVAYDSSQIGELQEKLDDVRSENQKLKDTITQPVLEYYKDGFRVTKDEATGQFKSSYVYRSKRPSVAIRDVKVELEFDKLIMKASCIIRQRKGGVSNESRVKEVVFDNDTSKITVDAKELLQGFEFIVEVVSDAPLKIVSNKFSPCR